jgi:pyruvate dehydrogenase E2 component (dihydrolipoamide acetyltransferase)
MTTQGRRPLTRMRRSIVKAMEASALVPQFTVERDVDVAPLAHRRERYAGSGAGLSDVLVAASARALVAHPEVNASFDTDAIVEHDVRNIGLAIALPDGLIAPAIKDADALTLPEIAGERRRLAAAAAAGTLGPDDLFSTTFTISNLGPLGVRRFRALVVPPQAAILAVGAITERDELSLALSCDHRVLDGAPAARFLAAVAELLEAPGWADELLGRAAG